MNTFENNEARVRFKTEQYMKFLESKIIQTPPMGFLISPSEVHPILKPHQADIVMWALEGGRRGIFARFGLGKTIMQLEIARHVVNQDGKPFLIGMPLGVRQEFIEDAEMLGVKVYYVRDMAEVNVILQWWVPKDGHQVAPIFLSNYERIREGKFDPTQFGGVSFDEGDAIRNLDTETTNYILSSFGQVPYRFIATATPSPNDYTELLNYAQFLGVMDRSQALTRFFQRNSTTAGDLTLYPHKIEEFWMWVRSWSLIIQRPSDLNPEYSDEGYDLPELKVVYHEVKVKERSVVTDRDGNVKMFRDTSKGLVEASKEKRESMPFRIDKAMELVQDGDNWILWHHLEDERKLIENLLPEVKSVFGSQKMETREENLIGFKNGQFRYLSTKPEIAGSGCNFQKHCHKAVFVGIDYRFKDFIQAIHRILRYGQTKQVEIHIIHSDAELDVLKVLLEKWQAHREMEERMSEIMRKYGLSSAAMVKDLRRSIGVPRKEAKGHGWKFVFNDTVLETMAMEDNSIDMVLTSIPFSDQYEYCESYHDMGHNDGDGDFFQQLDFLTPELLRVVKPGRIAAIHVKDRIRFSYQNGVGFTSLNDFSGRTVAHFEKHGWVLLGKHVITTDVVMENNQTYRLGWSEQCKDGTKMGSGSPEYLLVFRKAPTDISNAYADVPVTKTKQEYTRARWQLDAHAYWKSSGNKLLSPEELRKHDLSDVLKMWKLHESGRVYSFEEHVAICEELDKVGKLPARFMAIPPQSNTDWVWDDITRMRTLNTEQSKRHQEKHVCPLQFDIIERALVRYTNPGEVVFDPFGGIASVPYVCIPMKRIGLATELNPGYWSDGVAYCKSAEYKVSVPTLFDVV
jgi:DNA modification methylase